METPIRVYVGATEEHLVPCAVLEYSIRKHTASPVTVLPLYQSGIDIPIPKDPANRPFTKFSFQRFVIPEIQSFSGRAIYLDSDMLVFRDIRQLWEHPFDGAHLLAVQHPEKKQIVQFSVLVLDCAALGWRIGDIVAGLDQNQFTYGQLMDGKAVVKNIGITISPAWNDLEHFDPHHTALLHFTRVTTQPWLSPRNPLGYLWFEALFQALDAGQIQLDLVKDHAQRGFLRPSVLWQIEHRVADSLTIPKSVLTELDARFVFPTFRKPPLAKRIRQFFNRVRTTLGG